MTEDFDSKIRAFNTLYGLPAPVRPLLPKTRDELVQKLTAFHRILAKEVSELDDILVKLTDGTASQPEILTDIADWLGDLQVYCASEMTKYGLENNVVLSIIMASNMSKLGEDGKPIIDSDGKVCKGPNYWKPEPQIKRYIQAAARQEPGDSDDES